MGEQRGFSWNKQDFFLYISPIGSHWWWAFVWFFFFFPLLRSLTAGVVDVLNLKTALKDCVRKTILRETSWKSHKMCTYNFISNELNQINLFQFSLSTLIMNQVIFFYKCISHPLWGLRQEKCIVKARRLDAVGTCKELTGWPSTLLGLVVSATQRIFLTFFHF